ncbi:RCC1 domain-containing protein [Corallococcus carmarthensis]|uniref:RCC1 domain-containing protein n=1 Tax=Corallococcus carmarthensis TaxID=2316728 RepID=UPI0020A3BE1D|nr:PKD domain-containing protein [Corallococcus carmarthensis]
MERKSRRGLAGQALGLVLILAACGGQPESEGRASQAQRASFGFNSWPEVMGATAMPSSVEPGQTAQLMVYANDADGDPLSYEWTASCAGTWADASSANPSFTPSVPRPADGTCTLTVVARDGRGGQATANVILSVSGATCACSTPRLLVAGGAHSFALKQDGTVWAWGANHSYQLGFETYETTGRQYIATPTQVPSLTGVKSLDAGNDFSVALKQDGTVLAWGSNFAGQSGNGVGGFNTWISTPTPVPGVTSVASISAGFYHTLALKQDGTVWAWGYNHEGEMGDGTSSLVSPPVKVLDLTGILAVEAGAQHSLALKQDGTVWAWGYNAYGQLGDGTTTDRLMPAQVPGLMGVTAIAAGAAHSLALKQDGTVWAWGLNENGELGDGTNTNRLGPVQVQGLTGVMELGADYQTALALKQDGTVWGWGANHYGQLGDGTTHHRSVPMQVPSLSGAIAFSISSHVLALKPDGTVWAVGGNFWGALGDGTLTERHMPVQVQGLGN